MDKQVLAYYLKRHLTKDHLAYLLALGAPLTGPQGLRRWVAGIDAEAFTRLYFGSEFSLDFAPVHQRFLGDITEIRARSVAGRRGLKLARAIPRGHAKTTFYSRLLPLHGFLYGWSPLTVLLGNTDKAAQRLLKNIINVIDTTPEIQEDFPDYKGDYWGAERITSTWNTSIVVFGVGSGSIRGVSSPQRPRLVIGDDLDDDQLVRSEYQLDVAREWLDKAVMPLGDNVRFTSTFIFVGTIIKKTSLMAGILTRPDFDPLIEQGIKRFATNQPLWDQWRQWFLKLTTDGSQPKDADEDTFYQEHKAAMLEGTEVLWDRPDGYYYIMVYRLAAGDAAFFSEVQNTPQEANGTLGRPRYISRADLPPLEECEVLAALDPTEKGGANNDLAAYVELLFHPRTRRLFVNYLDAKRRSYKETIDAVSGRLLAHQQGGTWLDGFWVEENAAGGVVADLLNERLAALGVQTRPTKFYSSLPKPEKIEPLAEYTARNQLFIVEDLDNQLVTEWEAWPHGRNDDSLDAVGTIVRHLKNAGRLDLVKKAGYLKDH